MMQVDWKIQLVFVWATAFLIPVFALETAKSEASNMRLVGYNDLQGRTAYQPVIQKQGNRWIAYVGHHGDKKIKDRKSVV